MTFRVKLLLILGTATLTCVAMIAASTAMNVGQSRVLDDVERRLLPKLEAGPRIVAQFEALRRGMQDAVAAQDADALAGAARTKDELLASLSVGNAVTSEDRTALVIAVNEYYEQANRVSQRLIAGDTGETLEDELATMQARHHALAGLIERATRLKPNELEASFAAVRRATARANDLRIVLGISGVLALLALSLWVRRGVLNPLGNLSDGFARFAEGDFGQVIPLSADDELGAVAKEANQMAAKLRRLNDERNKREWLQDGLVGLSERLLGEHAPSEVSRRALECLAQRVDALAGALYVADAEGVLHLDSNYAYQVEDVRSGGALPTTFRSGEGLIGQSFADDRVRVVDDAPPDYLRIRSALGEAAPGKILFVPISHAGRRLGVLELALFASSKADAVELLEASRERLVIALEVAKSRATLEELLTQSRAQAERLTLQEEELRVTNQDLQAQQEELRQANEELEAQREALDRQNVALEAARGRVLQQVEELARVSSYKSQFLANMSHELRTPLNSMLLLSHLLAENSERTLTPRQVEHCKTIHGAGQDLLSLINQILDLAKIEAGKEDVRIEPVPLTTFCDHARRVFEPMTTQKGLELVIQLQSDLPEHLVTDRSRVERILTNLIGNALKFTERGRITLALGRPSAEHRFENPLLSAGSTMAFSVSDTGIGIDQDSLDRVFAPFEQVQSTARNYGGSGLGLAIARESARLLGGELVVESKLGQGSKFTLFLPEKPLHGEGRAKAPARPRDAAAGLAPARGRSEPAQERGCLLIIEDDEVLSEQLARVIRERGIGVLSARNGAEGLALARSGQPQGIVLDVKLPDVTGWEVMQQLRDDPETRSIPVHFLSGSDDAQRGLSLGAIGYLTKPATRDDLLALVRILVPGTARNHRRVLVVEDSVAEGQSLQQLLTVEGVESRHVATATGAFDALTHESFGCIILDLGLPDMDGLGLLKAIRERPDLPRPRVVVHTGRDLTKEEIRELEQYAEAVVLKDGSSIERLLEEIRLFAHHIQEELGLPAPAKAEVKSDLLKGKKVLLADDDMRTVYALSALLRSKGAEVIVADTGKEALEQMQRHPDTRAVLMDMMMPEMDGYEAIRRLRAQPQFNKVPIIALTAKAMKGERESCLAAGATDYLPKPVDIGKLIQALSTLLNASAPC